jgi:hypothetical protein
MRLPWGRGREVNTNLSARVESRMMGVCKRYEPHCPAVDCNGGRVGRLHTILPSVEKEIPPDVLNRRSPEMETWQCGYCGFVWFQLPKYPPGFEAIPAGKWDSNSAPGKFSPVKPTYAIREQNTKDHWTTYEERLARRRKGGRRGRGMWS